MTRTTLQSLLRYPHAGAFDKSALPALAFRLRHDDGAVWVISEGVLTATAGTTPHTISLAGHTIQSLANALTGLGFEVLAVSPDMATKSALVLIEGGGDQSQSNGDHLYGFTSLLWALMSVYAGELRGVKTQITEALRQMVITTADGEWVDVWGALYGIERAAGEETPDYAERIPREAFRIRVNKYAIERAILDATGAEVTIEEPWKDLFVLDESTLSGPSKLYDGERVGYHLIQPTARQSTNWPAVLPAINRNRAAGVLVLPPVVLHGAHLFPGDPDVSAGLHQQHGAVSRYEDRALLDYGAIEDVAILNHESIHLREVMHSSGSSVFLTWGDSPWLDIPWGSIYAIQSEHSRDYRFYAAVTKYSNPWGLNSWSSANSTWSEYPPDIHSLHTRT